MQRTVALQFAHLPRPSFHAPLELHGTLKVAAGRGLWLEARFDTACPPNGGVGSSIRLPVEGWELELDKLVEGQAGVVTFRVRGAHLEF